MPVARIIPNNRVANKICRAQFCEKEITDEKLVSKQIRGSSRFPRYEDKQSVGVIGNTGYYHVSCALKLHIITEEMILA